MQVLKREPFNISIIISITERDEKYWKWKEAVKRSCGWEVHPDQKKVAGIDDFKTTNPF
jgi:hypothetical protein